MEEGRCLFNGMDTWRKGGGGGEGSVEVTRAVWTDVTTRGPRKTGKCGQNGTKKGAALERKRKRSGSSTAQGSGTADKVAKKGTADGLIYGVQMRGHTSRQCTRGASVVCLHRYVCAESGRKWCANGCVVRDNWDEAWLACHCARARVANRERAYGFGSCESDFGIAAAA